MKSGRRSAVLLYAAITALILFRTLPFIFFGREAMDGDEGLFALMAKQLAEGRAFPIFGYGSTYNFGLSCWLAAPLIRLFGASVATVKAPLLALNLAVGNGTAFLLRREARLGAWETFLCCIWLALPSLETSRGLMDNCIGGIEPFFFIGLIWVLRKRPWLAGFLAGIEALQRPYVLYGVLAIWLFEAWLSGKRSPKKVMSSGFATIAAWVVSTAAGMAFIRFAAARFSSHYFGSGSPVTSKRFIFMLEDIRGYFAEIIPKTIGLQVQRFTHPVLVARDELARSSHFNAWGFCLSALGLALLAIAFRRAWRARGELARKFAQRSAQKSAKTLGNPAEELRFPFYLLAVGLISFGAYVVVGPPSPDIRYTFLLLLAFVGAYALYAGNAGRSAGRSDGWARSKVGGLAAIFALGCAANNAFALASGWRDLAALQRAHPQANLIRYLEGHGVTAALVDFASAYNLAFSSGERITVTDGIRQSRIPANALVYLETAPANRAEIELHPCSPAAVRVENWYVCIPGRGEAGR